MIPELTLGILSRGRPAEMVNALASAMANAKHQIHVIALFDEDYESAFVVKNYLKHLTFDVQVLSLRHYYVRGANAFLDLATTDKIVFSNDDVIFFKNWDDIALKALNRVGGIVELGGEPMKCAHFITTKTFLNEVNDGYIGNPAYTFYFSDAELMLRSMRADGYHWLNPGLISHDVVEDGVRSEVKFWMLKDKGVFALRHKELGFETWPDTEEEHKRYELPWGDHA